MVRFAAGQIIVIPFPFSDLSRSKLRPALLLANAGRGDWIACQITSNPYADPRAVEMTEKDFQSGHLRHISYARPGKLFTVNETLFSSAPATVQAETLSQVRTAVIELLQQECNRA